jgi:excisionase family DNA binding protein
MKNPFEELMSMLVEINNKIDFLIQQKNEQPVFLNIDQAAKMLNLSKSTVYKRTMKNEIPFHKSTRGGKISFTRQELENYIKGIDIYQSKVGKVSIIIIDF